VDGSSACRDLPRIPNPGTLLLAVDKGWLRLCSTEEGVIVDEVPLVDMGSPRRVDGKCLDWGRSAAMRGGFLVSLSVWVSPVTYSLEGPVVTRERLTLSLSDRGWELRGLSLDCLLVGSPRSQGGLSSTSEVIQLAAMYARASGRRPIGYRKVTENCWILAEEGRRGHSVQSELFDIEPKEGILKGMRQNFRMILNGAGVICAGVSVAAALCQMWWMFLATFTVACLSCVFARRSR
jgi:hypothetical protein